MASELQILADDLTDRIGRAVTINDKRWRLEVYTALHEEVDDARLQWILNRDAPDEVKAWAAELKLARARGPVRTPANPALGIESRVIFPMRYNDVLVGFMSIMDRDLSPDDLRIVAMAADEAAAAKYRDQLVEGMIRGRERELLRQLMHPTEGELRRQAAMFLRDEGLLVGGSGSMVAVVRLASTKDDQPPMSRLFDEAAERLRGRITPHTMVMLVNSNHVFMVSTELERLPEMARRLQETVSQIIPDQAVVGLGGTVKHLEDSYRSYRQALDASQAAARIPSFDGVATWENLGVYRVLTKLQLDQESMTQSLHPALLSLLEVDPQRTLIHTLETYLDLGTNAKATATRLILHRAGLYHRLARIRAITGVSLRDGETLLGLHLSIKLARLAGLYDHPQAS